MDHIAAGNTSATNSGKFIILCLLLQTISLLDYLQIMDCKSDWPSGKVMK
jgi:hypothetical protein